MGLYEINHEIQRIEDSVDYVVSDGTWIDMETGEIITQEEIEKRYAGLKMEKDEVLRWLAKLVLNDKAEIDALKAEEARLKARRAVREKNVERLLAILDRECAGEKKDLGVATASYRVSHFLDYPADKAKDIIEWCKKHRHKECIVVKEPELSKTELTKLLKAGVNVPNVEMSERKNFSLK